ncbi:hypothetical protein [Mycobacterium heckeshornense]|uniref:hypothetical protein n=1 Tax=Mycobacterium heckeshornense TaxID=110505 RepID=UPI000AA22FB6|nr:hypothetical protein [Mycobacterium heckeshornense]
MSREAWSASLSRDLGVNRGLPRRPDGIGSLMIVPEHHPPGDRGHPHVRKACGGPAERRR